MIVDLRLEGRTAVVVGCGSEGMKRVDALLADGCRVVVFDPEAGKRAAEYAAAGRIRLERSTVGDAGCLAGFEPHVVVAATDDAAANDRIVGWAREAGCLAYSVDSPESSDFANLAVVKVGGGAVMVAISTGGASPAMAGAIRDRVQEALEGVVGEEDVLQITLQQEARAKARGRIGTQRGRREFLYAVINDETVKLLVKDGDMDGARARMGVMLENWDED